jgi:hypothetical protein
MPLWWTVDMLNGEAQCPSKCNCPSKLDEQLYFDGHKHLHFDAQLHLTDSCALTDIYTLTHNCTWRTIALWRTVAFDDICALTDSCTLTDIGPHRLTCQLSTKVAYPYKPNDELFNIYYGIFYELWTFADFDRLCKLEKRGDEIKKKSSPLKLLIQSQPNFAEIFLGWSPSKIVRHFRPPTKMAATAELNLT